MRLFFMAASPCGISAPSYHRTGREPPLLLPNFNRLRDIPSALAAVENYNMKCGIPQQITASIVSSFGDSDDVLGIALTGTFSDGTHDRFSDVDIWIYHSAGCEPQRIRSLIEQVPGRYTTKPSHGAAYTLAEYIDSGLLVSVKLMSASVIEKVLRQQESLVFDEMVFEDIETILKWQILWERGEFLSSKTAVVRDRFKLDRERLLGHAVRRYGDMIWRSVFQGVYRQDRLQFIALVVSALNALVAARALEDGRVPPPMKWRFSSRTLTQLGLDDRVEWILEEVPRAKSPPAIFEIYRKLQRIEQHVLQKVGPLERWWWGAFDTAALNVSVASDLESRCREALRAQR